MRARDLPPGVRDRACLDRFVATGWGLFWFVLVVLILGGLMSLLGLA